MRRTIYLIIYTSPLFPAHWSLWIPRKDKPSVGKRIHAEGNSHSGFTIAFERNYNIDEDGRRYQLIALADVADACVEDSRRDEDELPSTDQVPCDRVEELALGVEAPGKSLKEVGTEVCWFRLYFRTSTIPCGVLLINLCAGTETSR